MLNRTRILIADDHTGYRKALIEALSEEASLEIVGEAADGDQAVRETRALKPDVVLMDLQMPHCNGVEATRRIQAEMPAVHILINTASESEADLFSSLQAGARGYVLKNEEPEMVIQAIRYVARGEMIVSPSMAGKLLKKKVVWQAEAAPAGDIPRPAPQPETKVSYAELVIPAPLEPRVVLQLHRWLTEDAKAEMEAVIPSMSGDTTLVVTFEEPSPLLPMLAELPFVAEVTEEPYTEGRGPITGQRRARRIALAHSEASRFRLRLRRS